jgi:hypothetical protein
MHLKLSAFEKNLVQEISVLSRYSQAIVREVLEFTFIRQVEQYFANHKMPLPFLGELNITFDGDNYIDGEREANLSIKVESSDLLKRVVGDVEDGNISIIKDLLEQKIKPAISSIITD